MKTKKIQENQILKQSSVYSKEFNACQIDILYSLLMVLTENTETYTFTKSGIAQLTGRLWNWEDLQDGTKRIGSRMIVIETDEYLEQMWLFGCVDFEKDESHFTVHLNANSIPYLMHAKNKLNTIQELKQIVYSKDQPLGKKRPN